jgi:hypothetical protein
MHAKRLWGAHVGSRRRAPRGAGRPAARAALAPFAPAAPRPVDTHAPVSLYGHRALWTVSPDAFPWALPEWRLSPCWGTSSNGSGIARSAQREPAFSRYGRCRPLRSHLYPFGCLRAVTAVGCGPGDHRLTTPSSGHLLQYCASPLVRRQAQWFRWPGGSFAICGYYRSPVRIYRLAPDRQDMAESFEPTWYCLSSTCFRTRDRHVANARPRKVWPIAYKDVRWSSGTLVIALCALPWAALVWLTHDETRTFETEDPPSFVGSLP